MGQAYRRFDAEVARWALDHPWKYAAMVSAVIAFAPVPVRLLFGHQSLIFTVQVSVLVFVPLWFFTRWLDSRPALRRRWEQRIVSAEPRDSPSHD